MAASVILEKMVLNNEENLTEIKREILKVLEYSGESAHLDPPADVNFNKNYYKYNESSEVYCIKLEGKIH